jgi:arylsulfatase
VQFIKKNHQAQKPCFAWLATSRMHFYTHQKPESDGVTGLGIYADGMVEHDGHVGQILDLLEELKIADNTIVVYTVDNGPHYNEWPDGGISPFRGEKNTNWEGGYRVPCLVRWPGRIPAGKVSNEIMSMQDWVPTLMAAAGEPDIKEKLMKGHKAAGKNFKVHLDGHNFLPYFMGEAEASPREEFFYFSDDGLLVAVRHKQWKLVFAEQRARTFRVWSEPFVQLRIPKPFNLRSDPFQRTDTDSNNYDRWWSERCAFSVTAVQEIVAGFIGTFKDFPPRQKPAKFNVDDVMAQMYKTGAH